jgi:uncharacterized protein DUF1629
MSNDSTDTSKRGVRSGPRRFYDIGPNFGRGGPASFEVENDTLLLHGQRVLVPPHGRRGFPDYPEPPRVLIGARRGRPPRDLEQYHAYWLISGRTKLVFDAVDATGFSFVRCETRMANGGHSPEYWLCDVIRVLDAVDETVSRMKIDYRHGVKMYDLMGHVSLVFKENVVGSAHIFRLTHLTAATICDERLKAACEVAELSGIKFKDMSNTIKRED